MILDNFNYNRVDLTENTELITLQLDGYYAMGFALVKTYLDAEHKQVKFTVVDIDTKYSKYGLIGRTQAYTFIKNLYLERMIAI